MDSKDREILAILQDRAVTSKAELARRMGLTPTAVFERVRKLEERGIIRGYSLRLDPDAFGMGLLAFVRVLEDERAADGTADRLAAIPGVEEVHRVAGDDGYLVKVRARDAAGLAALLDSQFRSIESVQSLRTSIVLETVVEGQPVPLDRPADPAPAPSPPNLLTVVQGREMTPPRRGRRTP